MYSSVFREMKKYQKDFPTWCGECQREKRGRQSQCVKATKMVSLYLILNSLHVLADPLLSVLRHLLLFGRRFSGALEAQRFNLYLRHVFYTNLYHTKLCSSFRTSVVVTLDLVVNIQLSVRLLDSAITGACKCKLIVIQVWPKKNDITGDNLVA